MTHEELDFELTDEQIDELEEEYGVPFQNTADDTNMSESRYSVEGQE